MASGLRWRQGQPSAGFGCEVIGGGVLFVVVDGMARLLGDPAAVGLHRRLQAINQPLTPGQIRQRRHAHLHLDAG